MVEAGATAAGYDFSVTAAESSWGWTMMWSTVDGPDLLAVAGDPDPRHQGLA